MFSPRENRSMHRFMACFTAALALLLATESGLLAAELRAASAKADITPTYMVMMWGYADRAGPAVGTRDPLYAKILLLDDGNVRLAWVTLDLGRPFGLPSMNV